MKKRLIPLMLAFPLATYAACGLDTNSVGEHLITSFTDLQSLQGNTSCDLSKTYRLTADIDAGYTNFLPIGNASGTPKAFTGVFHGAGHSISNLKISQTFSHVGLFGALGNLGVVDSLTLVDPMISGGTKVGALVGLDSGTVKNVTVSKGSVTGTGPHVGGVIGYGFKSVVKNVVASDSVYAPSAPVGGIVGTVFAGTFSNVAFSGVVRSVGGHTGGIAGFADTVNSMGTRFVECSNTGIIFSSASANRTGCVGGIVGYLRGGSVDSSFNTGFVTGEHSVGGIAGRSDGTVIIRYCFNTGTLTSTLVDSSGEVAGIIGVTYPTYPASAQSTISNCYNTGRVTSSTVNSPRLAGLGNVTGATANYSYCYNIGMLTSAHTASAKNPLFSKASGTLTASYCYWDTLLTGLSSDAVVTASRAPMSNLMAKIGTSYEGWNIGTDSSAWILAADTTTHPGLRALNNAPFTYPETLMVRTLQSPVVKLLANDYDVEKGQNSLVMRVDSVSGAVLNEKKDSLGFADLVSLDTAYVYYRAGELLTSGDTLWGNETIGLVILSAPFIGAYYALYAGKHLEASSAPVLDSLLSGTKPSIGPRNGMLDTLGVAWADSGEENYCAKGLYYQDTGAYVTKKNTSHILAHILPTHAFSGDSMNTLLTEGFYSSSLNRYTWLRVFYRNGYLHLGAYSFSTNSSGAFTSSTPFASQADSVACDSSAIFLNDWIPVHLVIRPTITGGSTALAEAYVGVSTVDILAHKVSLTLNTSYFTLGTTPTFRRVEIPQPTTTQYGTKTKLDSLLSVGGEALGGGSNLVGDFIMIASDDLTRQAVVNYFLGGSWKQTGAGTADSANYIVTSEQPVITQILYAAPGDKSTTSYGTTTSKSHTVKLTYGTSLDVKTGVGVEIKPELLTGFSGATISGGLTLSLKFNGSNSWTMTNTSYDGVSTTEAGGDIVVSQVMKFKHYLLERPRLRYITAVDDTISSHKVFYLYTLPEESGAAQKIQSVSSFLSEYKKNSSVIANFKSLYAKDVSTGKVRRELVTSGVLDSVTNYIMEGLAVKSSSETVTSQEAYDESFSLTLGRYMESKIVAGSASLTFNWSFNISLGAGFSGTSTHTFSTAYSFSDDDDWDQHDIKVFHDNRWAVPVFELQKDNSFTSSPLETLSQPVATIGLNLAETDSVLHVGDSTTVQLTVKNNSSASINNDYIDNVFFKVVTNDNFSGVYKLLELQPATFALARGDSQVVTIRYKASAVTDIPLGLVISDGYKFGTYIEGNKVEGKTVVTDPTSILPTVAPAHFLVRLYRGGMNLSHLSSNEQVVDPQGRIIFRNTGAQASVDLKLRSGIYLVRSSAGTRAYTVW